MNKPHLKSVPPPSAPPRPPRHLSKDSQQWWKNVVSEWALEGHHLRLLQLAAEAFDRAQMARRDIEKHGSLTVISATGTPKPHPAIGIERDARLAFARLLRELDLDCAGPGDSRPPSIRSNRR